MLLKNLIHSMLVVSMVYVDYQLELILIRRVHLIANTVLLIIEL